jgi:hypothetical protein
MKEEKTRKKTAEEAWRKVMVVAQRSNASPSSW